MDIVAQRMIAILHATADAMVALGARDKERALIELAVVIAAAQDARAEIAAWPDAPPSP